MRLHLWRIRTHQKFGTFGVLAWDSEPPFGVSLEDPWRDNQRNVSCIPAGTYECKPFDSPTHGPTYQITNVPDRTYILFHKGNTHINTQGCVLVGETYTSLDGIPAIGNSGRGFQEFLEHAPSSGFKLEIHEVYE